MTAFRFVHTADIHLDSPLKSLALRDPEVAALIGSASRTTFSAIIDLCLDQSVDALLIAGDLYDGDQTSMKTARFLAGELSRLSKAGIRTFIIRGNHDAMSRVTKELVLPEAVRLFGGTPDTVMIERAAGDRLVAIHGLSFANPRAPDNLVPRYKPAVADAINIGMLHTSLGGAPGHDSYAPCSPADLTAAGYDYWALGHIHKRAVIEGASTIVMPGIPQGRDINEDGSKSVTLVSIDNDRTVKLEEKPLALAEFKRVRIDVSGLTDWPDLAHAMTRNLETARKKTAAPELVARIELHGATPLAWRMHRDSDLLLEEAKEQGSRIGNTWIEKLAIESDAPPTRESNTGADPLVELQTLIADRVLGSAGFDAALEAVASQVQGQLPTDLRNVFGADEAATRAALQDLARDGVTEVLARLRAGPTRGET
ncbi:MAG: DNA repair exonuclease [Hoeflea sp.]|uniref:metallophosphoesterase family protein n=1 Tax=Hoeflea sp. TaxID=1940281 RepID=UPI0032EB25F5